MKKVIIAGGTGFLGKAFIHYLNKAQETEIYVLTRSRKENVGKIHYVQWDGETMGDWCNYLEKADLILNLAGRTVNCRYTKKNKNEIYDSRIRSTHILGKAVQNCGIPPKLWINMSTATIYRDEYESRNTETDGNIGEGFSVDVATKWEETFFSVPTFATRKIAIRTAIAFGEQGDVFKIFKSHVKLRLSGHHGHGRQWVSWIHEEDIYRAIMHLVENEALEGIFNLSSPNAIKDAEMMALFRRTMSYKWGLPIPKWMLVIGAFFLRTEPELILKSRWVYPERLLESGFKFKFPTMEKGIKEIFGRAHKDVLEKVPIPQFRKSVAEL